MSTRETILKAVLQNQPEKSPLPDISMFKVDVEPIQRYVDTFTAVGGILHQVNDLATVKTIIQDQFDTSKRIITTLSDLNDIAELYSSTVDPHTFDDVELAIIQAPLAVAENGAVWLDEQSMGQRIIPYICQHLAVIVPENVIVQSMPQAYEKIGIGDYGFGGFIGGPSKTADIEQALVLGAHGPITMTVFLLRQS